MNKLKSLEKKSKKRYLVLDILRGLTVAFMILVNTPGSWSTIYSPLTHASWNGFTPTDLVFPMFLFVVGNAMSFSMRKFKNQPYINFIRKISSRFFKIFIIGLILNAFPFFYYAEGGYRLMDFSQIRVMGVLQRIAIAYLIGSLIVYHFNRIKIIVISLVLLLGYWFILWYFGDSGSPYSLEGNAVLKLDKFLFNDVNLYQGYGIPFDPEGVLSTIPAIVNVIAGYFAGLFLISKISLNSKIIRFIFVGFGLVIVGQIWNLYFPINKPIWTSSYVLYSTGWSCIILALLILIVEKLEYKKWSYPFEAFGKNPLFIYFLSGAVISIFELIRIGNNSIKEILYENYFLSWLTPLNASLTFAIVYTMLMWLIGYWLDKRRIYMKV